jgi:HAE1 family hydrophobic/amphiphilic exporter-1
MNLPEFSVKRKITITMLILIIVLCGIISFFKLGLDLLPELEYPLVTVITRYSGVAGEDIEELITKPIEEAVSTVKNVKSIRSFSQEGYSFVNVEFEWGTNLDLAAQDIRDKISLIEMLLPEEADSPMVVKFDPSEMPVLVYAVTGMPNTMVLKKYLEENVTPWLERLEGVAAAMVFGSLQRQINIEIFPEKLKAYNLSASQIINALRRENLNISGGHLIKGHKEYLIRTIGEYKDLSSIEDTIIAIAKGRPIYIKDIACVKDAYAEIRQLIRADRKDCVMLIIAKQSGKNTVQVVDKVKKTISELKENSLVH